ncbi:hypothetical protein P280DRAFT_468349 [Massarina eburnea CBS 473.64]|uniref:C2H2-type domain-containing protein n=1 Tax=Massarina eburnea CBS 473.64 TaxID=1395130 RepID=A0A6A6S3Y9_9PLEO|nr:hypothetical protein P280DRAFT_468349 [Massarina eburnea CBS 473.64]
MGLKRSRQDSVSSSEGPLSPVSRDQSVDVKIVHLNSAVSNRRAVMKCSLSPHQLLEFASFEDYDVHYQKQHMNRCSECHKNFPDDHFLHLHIAENHDPIRAAKMEQGEKTFACFLADCDRFCSSPHKRRLHCIDKHHFPRNYDFFIVNDGIDRRSSMLRSPHRRRSSTVNSTTPVTGRGRSDSGKAEAMDIVKDEGGEKNQGEEEEEPRRTPVKLRGRGGFGHPRGGRGRGRGRDSLSPKTTSTTKSASDDAMEGLAAGMSALQFVPHSLYSRGRGRARGTS